MLLLFIGAALILFLAWGGWLAQRGQEIAGHLGEAKSLASDLSETVLEGDTGRISSSFEELRAETSRARELSSSPLWTAAGWLPIVGDNFSAISSLSLSVDDIVSSGIEPIIPLIDLKSELFPSSGGLVDTDLLQEISPIVVRSSDIVSLSYNRIAAIETRDLHSAISNPILQVLDVLSPLERDMNMIASASAILPAMLGDDSPRRYLVLVQNNAEVRATGGIPGALAVIETENGKLSLREQASAADMGVFSPPIPTTDEQVNIFTSRLGTHMQNVNLTPHFPTAAHSAKQMWEKRHPQDLIDGVIALDPFVLSTLLGSTGAIQLQDPAIHELISGTSLPTSLSAENVTATLLSDVYREISQPERQDAYFAAVATGVFEMFTTSSPSVLDVVEMLGSAVGENRLYTWSSHEDEQQFIASTRLAGDVTGALGGGPTFGAYFNDGTGAKMDYYADRTAQLIEECRPDGEGQYKVRISATNNAPLDARQSLPTYVTGDGVFGVEPGHIRTNYVVYGPAQSLLERATLNGETVSFASGRHAQRPVGTVTLELAPGESAELEFTFFRVLLDTEPKLVATPSSRPQADLLLPTAKGSHCD